MKTARYAILGVALAGLTVAGVAMSGVSADATLVPPAKVYEPAQAISQYFGSKHAVGYFLQQDATCAMTVFISEDTDGRTAPSATRVKVTVKPGDKAEFGSVETQTLEVTCGANAATVEVKNGNFQTAYVTH